MPANKRRTIRDGEKPKGDGFLPNDSLVAVAYRTIKKDIITGLFKPGEALSENRLAIRYSISRTPIREAAARLEQENLLRLIPNKGYFVTRPNVNEINALYQYRAILEGASAELAAERGLERDQLKRLQLAASVQYKMRDRSSYVRFIENDTAFHMGIAEAAGNELLTRTVSDLRNQIERLLYATIDIGEYGALIARQHCDILRAIKNRNSQLAKKLMLEHVSLSRTKVLQLV